MATMEGRSVQSGTYNSKGLVGVGSYIFEKTIGKGNFAIVKLATHTRTQSKVAVKIIDKEKIDPDNLRKIKREIEILKRLSHPYIIRLYQVMQSQTKIYLVTEYAQSGELFDFLAQNGKMTESKARGTFMQIIAALRYCHTRGIVHRDLKAENLLLDKDLNIKLADFGFSNYYTQGVLLSTWCGSPPYAAPELFEGKEYDGPKADIWSLGVILYVLVCGHLPFDAKTLQELRAKVVAGKCRIPYFMSTECEQLIRMMLQVDPDKRLSIERIMRHKWVLQEPIEESIKEVINHYDDPVSDEPEPEREDIINEILAKIPGLEKEQIQKSLQEKRFDDYYAIYTLLIEKMSKSQEVSPATSTSNISTTGYLQPLPVVPTHPRKSSITTGFVDRSPVSDSEDPSLTVPLFSSPIPPALHDPYQSTSLEKYGDIEMSGESDTDEPSTSQRCEDKYLCSRRHTVGPGDPHHQQVLDSQFRGRVPLLGHPGMGGAYGVVGMGMGMGGLSLLPQTNLPQNLPLVQNLHPQNFSNKDQHLLKPPPFMGNGGGLGRRASDGGANLQMYFQRQLEGGWSHPNSREHLAQIPMGLGGRSQPLPQQESVESAAIQEPEVDQESLQQYMSGRGGSQRVTLPIVGAGKEGGSGERKTTPKRRTGLLTVTERHPVFDPELLMEFEDRMRRPYTPPALQNLRAASPSHGSIMSGIPPSPVPSQAVITPGIVSGIPPTHLATKRPYQNSSSSSSGSSHGGISNSSSSSECCQYFTSHHLQFPYSLNNPLPNSVSSCSSPPHHPPPSSNHHNPSSSASPCSSITGLNPGIPAHSSNINNNHIISQSSGSSSAGRCKKVGNRTRKLGWVQGQMSYNTGHLATVLENNWHNNATASQANDSGSAGRESYKDSSNYLSCERYSPVNNSGEQRRASDSTISLSNINQEFQKLQRSRGSSDATVRADLQRGHSLHMMGTSLLGSQGQVGAVSPAAVGGVLGCPPSAAAAIQQQQPQPTSAGSPSPCPSPHLSTLSSHHHSQSPLSRSSQQTPVHSPPLTSSNPPSIPGSPLHGSGAGNIEGTALSLSRLQLQPPSSPGCSPRSLHRRESPPLSLSPVPHSPSLGHLSPVAPLSPPPPGGPMVAPRSGPSPPPLGLDSIREEPPRIPRVLQIPRTVRNQNHSFLQNPQISITDETGDQIVIGSSSESSPDISDEMDLSPYTSPITPDIVFPHLHSPNRLSKGYSLDSSPLPCIAPSDSNHPSIMRGTPIRRNQLENNNIHHARNEKNLVRQDAITGFVNNRHQMYITSSVELRHSFPPFLPNSNGSTGGESDTEMADVSPPGENSPQGDSGLIQVELHKTGSGSILISLPTRLSNLPQSDILGSIIGLLENKAPELVHEVLECGLSLRDPTGAQIDLEVYEGPAADSRSLKMRRVSGDEQKYTQLCHQLIQCMES